MSDDLVRVRNTETGEELLIGRAHLNRWPDDPFEVIDDAPEPSPSNARGELPSAYADQQSPSSTF